MTLIIDVKHHRDPNQCMKLGLPRDLLCRVVLQWKLAGKFEVHIMGENTKSMYHKFCGTFCTIGEKLSKSKRG